MNKTKLAYIISTGLVSLMSLGAAMMYFTSAEVAENFTRMGFPSFFRVELGIAKILGVIALVVPIVPNNIKEWAYAGFGITFISAVITHVAASDPFSAIVAPVVAFGILTVSYIFLKKLQSDQGTLQSDQGTL